uniref:transporter n=1 Tax=Pseudoalteromonas sp. S16_S37 TaxID=2720228 RepID=UPI003144DFDB
MASEAPANQETVTPINFSVYAGFTHGGDKLIELQYEGRSNQDIRAGGAINLGAGLNYQFNNKWSLQSNLGYHFDSDNASNADITFSRWALDVIPYYQLNDSFKVGVGITYHLNTELEMDMNNTNSGISFKNTAGVVASLGYQFENHNGWLEARFVKISYDADKVNVGKVWGINVNQSADVHGAPSISGNHIGLAYHYVF